jgi:hypothetical protein
MDAHFDTLAAWADGETVDRTDVLRALESAEARDYIVDVMARRRMVAVTTPAEPVSAARTLTRRWVIPEAAAAVLCLAVGYTPGRVTDRTVPAAPPAVVPVSAPAVSSAPAPTRVIRFEAGVDWRETAGGD